MRRRAPEEERENVDRWVVSYADFITLLFAFFTVLYAISSVDSAKLHDFIGSTRGAFGSAPVSRTEPVIAGIVPLPPSIAEMEQTADRILASANANGVVTVRRESRGLALSMGEDVLFDAGTATVKPSSLPFLAAVASVLKASDGGAVVEGHTDSLPISNSRYASNWELSSARATKVLECLVSEYGVPPARLSAAGYAEYRPVASNATPEGRARNRRVDVVLLPTARRNGGT
jgi:chemotaxis protein MotB